MKLVGNYLSHFVRRVAIPMHIYGLDFELAEVSVVSDQDIIKKHSKLARIPSLVLDSGETLIDSHYILEAIDAMAPEADRLVPTDDALQQEYGQVIASLTGAMDKATAWYYEKFRRPEGLVWDDWAEQLRQQLAGGILQVEERFAAKPEDSVYLFENRMTHADIAVGLAYPLGTLAAPDLVNKESCPRLAKLAEHMNAMAEFKAATQGEAVQA